MEITPMEALNTLYKLKQKMNEEPKEEVEL